MRMKSKNQPSSKLVFEYNELDFPIQLLQHPTKKTNSFTVVYGLQVDSNLSYSQACSKLGEALMHAFALRGFLDNERN